MDFENCRLYGIETIEELSILLESDLSEFQSSINLWRQYNIRLYNSRVIESPSMRIKEIQKRILALLYKIPFPDYVYSVPGKSAKDAASLHKETSLHLIVTDISKFFMSTGREKVYRFWLQEMKMSLAVANVMANLTTMDLRKCPIGNVTQFISDNSLCVCHLGTGFPSSNLLAFLCNHTMYEELFSYCETHSLKMSVFVDDIIISSQRAVSRKEFDELKKIINEHGYKVNIKKTRIYNNVNPKMVLGLLLYNGKVVVPNKKHLEAFEKKKQLEKESSDEKLRNSYLGLVNYIRNSEG